MGNKGLQPQFVKAYEILKEAFGEREFTLKEAEEVLKTHKGKGYAFANVREILANLQKEGLVSARPSEEDKRKKLYKLKELFPTEGEEKDKLSKGELIALLKRGADIIRTSVDYKVLAILLFYKAVSDKFNQTVEKLKEEYPDLDLKDIYDLANEEFPIKLYDPIEGKLLTWHATQNDNVEFINALKKVGEINKDKLSRLDYLLTTTGFYKLLEHREILEKLKELFARVDFSKYSYDLLGDAYEWILNYFAPQQAKEGEVFTPIEVGKLISHLIDAESNSVILDPACGSAGLLIEQHKRATQEGRKNISLIGQERNETIAGLAEMNLILHGIVNGYITVGDSLLNPLFEEKIKELKPSGRADYVVANPPWNQKGVYTEEALKKNPKCDEIFTFGYPPAQSADWAWMQLINYYTEKKAAVVFDNGILFRGGREKAIREKFVKNDLIEAIILLPEKIFYNTQAPGVIIVLNKNKPSERKEKILFINASNEYIPHPEVKKLNTLSEENIKKIAETYRGFKEIEGFSRAVDIKEIAENDYNLNVSLYVSPLEDEEEINLQEEYENLKQLKEEYEKLYNRVEGYIREVLKLLD
ncbi:MAG TPA: DNA methyltransferase [Aquificales bacterium]|nr:DNA methyltransferase [Aquificales bacterium]